MSDQHLQSMSGNDVDNNISWENLKCNLLDGKYHLHSYSCNKDCESEPCISASDNELRVSIVLDRVRMKYQFKIIFGLLANIGFVNKKFTL